MKNLGEIIFLCSTTIVIEFHLKYYQVINNITSKSLQSYYIYIYIYDPIVRILSIVSYHHIRIHLIPQSNHFAFP